MSAVLTKPDVLPETPLVPLPPPRRTLADLLHELGDVPADRVRLVPTPGTATEADLLAAHQGDGLSELVNGTLVEKPMGSPESFFAAAVVTYLNIYVWPRQLGSVTVTDGMYRMTAGNIREPDVSFTHRDRGADLRAQVSDWCPDLCVEVISPSNTRAEMAQKRAEYFANGCRLVWEVDPKARTATVYTDPTTATTLDESGTLDGGDVLPGFTLPLAELFGRFDVLVPPPSP